ncbi:PdaC/SigV domain-containing protein [Paenibacillus sp. D51F]
MTNRNESKKRIQALFLGLTSAALLSTASLPSAYAAALSAPAPGQAPASSGPAAYASLPASAQEKAASVSVTAKKIVQSTSALKAVLFIPVVSGLKDASYQKSLNDKMERAAMADLDAVKKQSASGLAAAKKAGNEFHPYEIKLQYSAGLSGTSTASPILSLKLNTYIYTGGAHGISRIDAYNVKNAGSATAVTLKTLFGDSYPAAINAEIKRQISRNADGYFKDAFTGVAADQPFYLKDGSVQVVFQPYEIAPYASGIPVFAIPLPSSSNPTPAVSVKIDAKPIRTEDDLYKADIDIPVLSGLLDAKFQDEWNAKMEQAASNELDSLKKAAAERKKASPTSFIPSEIKTTFEVVSDGSPAAGGIVSIKMTTYTYEGGANGDTHISASTFRNASQASPVTLAALFGNHYESEVGAAVQAAISKDKENYFAGDDGFRGVTADSVFYVKAQDAYVVFQQGEIAPRASGNPEFKIPLPVHGADSKPLQVIIGSKALTGVQAVPNKDGVAIVPVRDAAEALGYKLKWDARTSTLELSKGSQWTAVTIGSDSYTYNKMAPVALGAAPAYDSKGRMTVPLAFFTEILHAKASYGDDSVTLQN